MAKPRVFVSSTYFDLKSVRADVERFILDQGFEPILNERGHVPYGKEDSLENYCYKEIETCDILVSIIGGQFGSTSAEGDSSVSQKELKTAISEGKQVYVFIDRDVYAEHKTYVNNQGKKIAWAAVNNEAVYKFISEIYALPRNNQIAPFETSQDIIRTLKEQWAGLFADLLRQQSKTEQVSIIRELSQGVDTVRNLVDFLTEQKQTGNKAVETILLADHPIFHRLQRLLKVKYRVFFTNLQELNVWLEARNYELVEESKWDHADTREWIRSGKPSYLLKIVKSVFDDNGKLRVITPNDWDDTWVRRSIYDPAEDSSEP